MLLRDRIQNMKKQADENAIELQELEELEALLTQLYHHHNSQSKAVVKNTEGYHKQLAEKCGKFLGFNK